MRTIVHLSDLHFGRVEPPVVDGLVAAIQSVTPDLVAVSGDLTQRARRREFAAARAFLEALPFPRLVVPGNHDVPLHNPLRRFLSPLARFREYVHDDLEPTYEDDEVIVVGLNSARSWTLGGAGRLNASQVGRAIDKLRLTRDGRLKVIVTHHPFDLPSSIPRREIVGGARRAMAGLASAGADLFLAGHLHVAHIGRTAERYDIAGHSALVVQAGTISTRRRGEPNSFNVLELSPGRIRLTRRTWDDDGRSFLAGEPRRFRHTDNGWIDDRS